MSYDIVLVYALSRIHTHYLSIARHLGRRLRIGLWMAPIDKALKTQATERTFLDLCRGFGVEILSPGRLRCRLLAVPQYRYHDGALSRLAAEVQADRKVALQTFGHGAENLEPLTAIGIDQLFVYDRRVFDNKPKTLAQARMLSERLDIVEMGSPFAKYPAFEADFGIDFMIAFPTDLSFIDGGAKARFVAHVNRLLDEIPCGASIVHKLHNVSDGGRLNERHSLAFQLGRRLGTVGIPIPRLLASASNRLARLAFGAEYAQLTRRARPLDVLTPYFNMGLELFLPWVRQGLVTGRSSVVWYALVHRLPVFNCDDETERARGEGVTDSYRAFGVPPCHGRLAFDPRQFERISESVRQADLLDLLQKEL